MSKPLPRSIPLAAAASTLTFGACGDDKPPLGDGERLESYLDGWSQTLCDVWERCSPEDFYFDNPSECVRYYDSYFEAYGEIFKVEETLEQANDPAQCEATLLDMFECYTDIYTGAQCEAIYCDMDDPDCDYYPCDHLDERLIETCGEPFEYTAYGAYLTESAALTRAHKRRIPTRR